MRTRSTQKSLCSCMIAEHSNQFLLLSNGNVFFSTVDEFLVSKETVVLRPWERSKQKSGFMKRVDKG